MLVLHTVLPYRTTPHLGTLEKLRLSGNQFEHTAWGCKLCTVQWHAEGNERSTVFVASEIFSWRRPNLSSSDGSTYGQGKHVLTYLFRWSWLSMYTASEQCLAAVTVCTLPHFSWQRTTIIPHAGSLSFTLPASIFQGHSWIQISRLYVTSPTFSELWTTLSVEVY